MTAERVLLLGGAGFVGSAIAADLLAHGAEVTVIDAYRQFSDPFEADYSSAMTYRARLLAGARLLRGDAASPLDLLSAFETSCPQRVVHLAAVASAPLNETLVAEAVHNASASVVATFQLARRFDVRRVLLVSSSYVYGDFQRVPCDETHPTDPRTVYGAAKLTAEVITRALSAQTGVEHTVVRLIAVYGPWDLNGKLSVPNLREVVATGHLPISGGSEGGTDYTHVNDAAHGVRLALLSDGTAGETLNIARGRARTAQEVSDVLSSLGYPNNPTAERVGGRPRRGALATAKAARLLGYVPATELEEGLPACMSWVSADRPVQRRTASIEAHTDDGATGPSTTQTEARR